MAVLENAEIARVATESADLLELGGGSAPEVRRVARKGTAARSAPGR